MLTFYSPIWFVVAGVLAFLYAARFVWRRRHRAARPPALSMTGLVVLETLPNSWFVRLRPLVVAIRVPVLALLLVALARPQTTLRTSSTKGEGIDIMLVVDTSGSMAALDLDTDVNIQNRKNRLEVVKEVVHAFVSSRHHDQIGLVVFGEHAFSQCPLTRDHEVVTALLKNVEMGMAGQATAIGDGLGIAVKRLRESKAKSKVVILLTDGANNAGIMPPETAAALAKQSGVKVYTIGAGTKGKAPVLRPGLFGGSRVAYIDAEIDDDALKNIASVTDGEYFRAEDSDALTAIYEKIDKLERSEVEELVNVKYTEEFHGYVGLALMLLLIEILLLNTRFRRLS